MSAVITSLLLSLRQLGDPAVLRVLLKSAGVSLMLFVALAGAGWWLIDAGLAGAGLADDQFGWAGSLRGALALLLALAGLWLGWRIIAMAVIQFFAEEVVRAVEARHYPHAASAAIDLTWREELAAAARSAARALAFNLAALPLALALIVSGLGPALVFWVVNAVLVGRELQDMVWLRHRRGALAEGDRPCPVSKAERTLLGGAITAMLAFPVIALLAPVLGAAAAAHLVHRKPLS